jgi:mRNA-degrading endonuclease RelE of RelBE toxin-antitoxin system
MKTPGNSLYSVEYMEDVVSRDIPSLSKSAKTLILKAIEERLMVDPISFGKPLRYTLKGYRRLRVGRYRIVYKIDEKRRTVIVNAIDHRKDAYAN